MMHIPHLGGTHEGAGFVEVGRLDLLLAGLGLRVGPVGKETRHLR